MRNKNVSSPAVKVHPPYAMEYWKLHAMFDGDPDIVIGELNDSNKSCSISFASSEKADLFESLIHVEYLNIEYEININTEMSEANIAKLFSTNPHFSRLMSVEDSPVPYAAVLFKAECMHYFSDDFFSPTGHTAILPETLAVELLGGDNCTALIRTDLN